VDGVAAVGAERVAEIAAPVRSEKGQIGPCVKVLVPIRKTGFPCRSHFRVCICSEFGIRHSIPFAKRPS
jgi:hypothetical protein